MSGSSYSLPPTLLRGCVQRVRRCPGSPDGVRLGRLPAGSIGQHGCFARVAAHHPNPRELAQDARRQQSYQRLGTSDLNEILTLIICLFFCVWKRNHCLMDDARLVFFFFRKHLCGDRFI